MLAGSVAYGSDYLLYSPDKQIEVKIQSNTQLTWSVSYHQQAVLAPSVIALAFTNGMQCGVNGKVLKEQRHSVNEVIEAAVPVKSRWIANQYNEVKLLFDKKYAIVFRAYDNGVAYRFETAFGEGEVEVAKEDADFVFTGNNRVLWSDEKDTGFQSHFESLYIDSMVAAYGSDKHAALPFYTQSSSGVSMIVSESDLYDYPNLFLFGTGTNRLTAGFPRVIQQQRRVADRRYQITQLAPYIAKTKATRTYPWRLLTIADNDKALLESNLTYQLSSPSVIKDASWIKPGKVAWDWWNANNIYGVPFASGINTETYKYYVDFASAYHLEYVILDEGWSRTTVDVLHSNAQLDIHELIRYATTKNVGIILWTLWNPLDSALHETLDTFAAWGVKGIKVDFMARADQYMVNYYERVAKAAADRKLLVDLHGAYKPVGLNRKYPNVLSYEGVRGLENDKWSDEITPKHDVTLPFTRMVAGPMDFTPGAMINSNKRNFHISFTEPMSQGTRAHQVAMYVVYESPLQMLADNPSNYLRDSACTRFIAQMPVTWDTTIALHGKAGEYVAVARKHGDNWYIGAMTNWTARSLTIPLTFLENGQWQMQALKDGVNANNHAADYTIENATVTVGASITIELSSGGGWSAVLTKKTL
ncbi:alpha-glucosidase [Filimonas lacunae]|nr:alpha-glucosidase [Filimonas lacunae]